MKKLSIIFLISISLFASCTRDIELYNTADFEPELVVFSTITNDDYIYVLVSKTGVPKQLDSNIFIDDAVVEIYENGIQKSTLPYYKKGEDIIVYSYLTDTPHYRSDFKANSENTYTVKVKAMGKTIEKEVIFPKKATNTQIEFSNLQMEDTINLGNGYMDCNFSFSTRITINDQPGKDYYFILLYTKDYIFDYDTTTYVYGDSVIDTFITPISLENDNELNNMQSVWGEFALGYSMVSGDIYNDEFFSGQSYNINSSNNWLNTTFKVGQGVKIYYQTYTLSEDLFKYFVSEQKNNNSVDNPFVEPVNIYSNLDGAIGVIAAMNSTIDSVIIPLDDFTFLQPDGGY